MRTKNVVVLESNVTLQQELKEAMESSEELRVVYAGDDGEAGIKQIQLKPEMAIVGMFLKGTDGCGVIRAIRKQGGTPKIIATGVSNDALMEKAMNEGADYYLVKPFSISGAIERMKELMRGQEEGGEGREYASAKRKPQTLDEKISDIFISIGIPPHIKGYGYLREGIKLTVEKPYIINNVTKGLYPSIAKKFETTPSKVERAIRHAIEVAWNRGRIEAINAIFGTRIYLGTEKPTNSEFIALVADKLILENMI